MNVVSRSYRRAAFRRWGLPEHSTLRVALRGSTAVSTTAAPRQVWAVLSDVTRVGEWSHECQGASWLDGATSLAVGARFRGRNRAGSMRWSRPCTVTSLVPGEEVTWVTDGGIYGDNAAWRFRLVPDGTGTRIEQSFRVVNLPAWFDRFIWRMLPSHHDRSAALAADLERLGTLAAAET